MDNLDKTMLKIGFLKKFIDIYFYRMQNLGFSKQQAFDIISEQVRINDKKDTFTNVFDVIEIVKKQLIKY